MSQRLGNTKIDDLRNGPPIVVGDQHVAGLEIAVNDALLVGMLNGLTNRDKQGQPFSQSQPVFVAILGDRNAFD